MPTPLLDAALWAVGQGWHVHPLKPGTKLPATAHGFMDASTDPDRIRAWWAATPEANIGVATEASGLAVVDVDDLADLAVLDDMLTATLTATTGGGGLHLIYTGDVPNSAKRLAPGTDTRGRGGYIVLPPSRCTEHVQPYTWRDLRAPGPVPDEVVAALAERTTKLASSAVTGTTQSANTQWGERVLHAELGRIAAAAQGTRNDTLFRAAANVFECVKGGHIPEAAAWDAMRRAAQMCGHDGDTELTLSSAWERVEPRHPKERNHNRTASGIVTTPQPVRAGAGAASTLSSSPPSPRHCGY